MGLGSGLIWRVGRVGLARMRVFLLLRGASFFAAVLTVVVAIAGPFGGGRGGIASGRVLSLWWWEGFEVRRERGRRGWGWWVGWVGWDFWWGRGVGRTLW